MSNILVLKASASGPSSVSNLLIDAALRDIRAADPAARITVRDFGREPLPHLTEANLPGVRGVPSTDEHKAARELSDALIAELKAADTLLIGAPMYNFSVPTTLRSWFDFVLRAGETFRYSEAGPEGLVKGKRVIVIETRGGLYSEGPAAAIDFQEPYLRQLFAFMGVTDVTFIHAEKIGYGPDARDAAIASAESKLGALLRQPAPAGA
ncbi:FMN-dependent NADH-azoreductase [Hyphomonas sp.]|uniref:FMN-dependent NADH-azoreductase n=1 Tax=Hyphomonas sp. TaxID=87 RepID=UPI0039188294